MLEPQPQPREQQREPPVVFDPPAKPAERVRRGDPYHDWLDRPKNLSGEALTAAYGLVRVRNPGGTEHLQVDQSKVDQLLEQGWTIVQPSDRRRRRRR